MFKGVSEKDKMYLECIAIQILIREKFTLKVEPVVIAVCEAYENNKFEFSEIFAKMSEPDYQDLVNRKRD